jgi:hypothetical protein
MTLRIVPWVAALAAAAAVAAGCGGDGGGSEGGADDAPTAPAATSPRTAPGPATAPAQAPAPAPVPLPGLPPETAGFAGWDRLNRAPIPPDSPQAQRVGFDAHRGVKHVYVRVPRGRPAAGTDHPDGTVIVKAAGEDPLRPTLVAVMRKVAGSDPAHGDWRFEEYTRAAPGERFEGPLTGEVCWSCHAIASETDWVFTASGSRGG